MSPSEYTRKFPTNKISRPAKDAEKAFVCRRGCNTRTATYSDDFVWEDIFTGTEDSVYNLIKFVKTTTTGRLGPRQSEPETDQGEGAPDWCVPPITSQSERYSSSKKKKQLTFTPLATRTITAGHAASSYQLARARLHVSAVPMSLPCREKEFQEVYARLTEAIADSAGNCFYISGTPGTGKTATVREVVSHLERAVQADELEDFIFVEINGMKLTDPYQSYSLLWEALRGQRVSPSQALDLLEREFNNPSPRRVPCVVLMDELDQLVTKNQGIMYNFFNWPSLRHSKLIVLAVANTMDLPERTLSNKISSRLGTVTVYHFPAHTTAGLAQDHGLI
jgi:origin recognition complex subunit 1